MLISEPATVSTPVNSNDWNTVLDEITTDKNSSVQNTVVKPQSFVTIPQPTVVSAPAASNNCEKSDQETALDTINKLKGELEVLDKKIAQLQSEKSNTNEVKEELNRLQNEKNQKSQEFQKISVKLAKDSSSKQTEEPNSKNIDRYTGTSKTSGFQSNNLGTKIKRFFLGA